MKTRRDFLSNTAGAAALTALTASAPRLTAQAADARIEVLTGETIGTIAPEIYGHFVEHLGGVVYDGIWVGENSKIDNIGGLRRALVESLKRVRPGVIRWPGGCFADQYDWRDGIGLRDRRPRRTNFWADTPEWPKGAHRDGPQMFDPNEFGTTEFSRFCRVAGAEPYFASNLRSLPAQEYWRWVEYCNSPAGSTTLADQRAADGSREPLNVRFWGVGNESWGCGGNFTPEDYVSEFRRYSAWVPSYGVKVAMVASGPNGNDLDWTRRFFAKLGPGLGPMWGWALHHYAWNASGGRTTEWSEGKRDALRFTPEEYYEILNEANRVEPMMEAHWKAMGEVDRRHKVKIVVDEWGAWYAPGTEPFPEALLGQQNTMRDAVLAGLSLDIFNRNADKVGMANVAQLVNCLQSLFLAHEDRFCLTPTYHVFDMYSAHQGAEAVRTVFTAPPISYIRNEAPAELIGLAGSASVRGRQITLTVANPHLEQSRDTEISVRGGFLSSARATTLSAQDAHAHNTLSEPRAVEPGQPQSVTVNRGRIVHRFPPASVTKLELGLA